MGYAPILLAVAAKKRGGYSGGGSGCAVIFVSAALGTLAVTTAAALGVKAARDDDYQRKYDLIVMHDGEEYKYENLKTEKETEEKYEVFHIDEKTLAVVVYDNSSSIGESYTDFIESCIYLDQNNNVYFDVEAASDEKYTVYQMQAKSQNKIKRKTL